MNINRNYLNLTLILFGIGFVLTFSSLYILNTYLGKNLYLGELPELLANDFTRVYYFTKHGLSYDYVRNYFPSEPLPYGSLTLIIFKIFSFLPIQISVILFYFIFIVGLLAIHYTLIKNSNYTKLNKIYSRVFLGASNVIIESYFDISHITSETQFKIGMFNVFKKKYQIFLGHHCCK